MKTMLIKIKTFSLLTLATSVSLISTGYAANVIKLDTTTMNGGAADWSAAPAATDIGEFDATAAAGTLAAMTLGGNLNLGGLQLDGTMNGPLTIASGNTLTLGTNGINMGSANQSLTLNCGLTLASGRQAWNVVGGQTLTIGGTFSHTGASVDFTSFAGSLGTLGNVNGILGPWAFAASGAQYATVSGGVVSAYTGGTAAATAAAVTDTTGTVNYDVAAIGTLGAGASFNTLRYTGTAGTIAGNFTANGLLNGLTYSGGITIGSTKELVLASPTASFTFTGPFTGAVDTVISIYSPSSAAQVNLGGTGAGTQMANFSGTIKFGNSACIFKMRNDSAAHVDKGMSNAVVDLGTGSTFIQYKSTAGSGANSGSPTLTIGALMGGPNTALNNGDSSGGNLFTYTYKVGFLNTDAEFDGTIKNSTTSGGTVAIAKVGSGTWTVPNANSYGGITTLSGGALSTGFGGTLANGGANSSIGKSANTAANLVLDGGKLQYVGTNASAVSSDRLFTLTANGGGFDASGANTLTLAGNGANLVAFSGSGARTLTLTGTNTGANTFAPILGDGTGGATALIKNGAGQWVFTAANTYSGSTTVSNGTLTLSGSGSIANSTSVTVNRGASLDVSAVSFTLGGSQSLFGGGVINGSINTASGSKVYAGTDGGYGTNIINNNLTMVAGALCYLDLGTLHNGSNDLVSVGGTLTLTNTVFHLKAPSTLVNLDQSADYILMSAASIAAGSTVFATPTWDVSPLNAANFSVAISGNNVVLHYAAATPPTGVGSANPSPVSRGQTTKLTVVTTPGNTGGSSVNGVTVNASTIGASSSVSLVQSNSTSVWTNTVTVGTSAVAGNQSLPVTITATAGPSGVSTIAVTVLPDNQIWNGGSLANDNWTSGANWLGGIAPHNADSVTFAGSTRLTPNLDSSYSLGALTFSNNAGSFNIGTANSSTLTLTGGVTNNSANAQIVNVPVALISTQAISTTAGNLTLGGVVSGSLGLTKTANNALTLTGVNTYSGDTVIGAGTLRIDGAGQLNSGSYAGNITDNGVLTYNSTASQVLAGFISGTGALTNSAGALTLSSSANNYSGGTTVSGTGTLTLSSGTSAGTGPINLASGGTLTPSGTFTNPVTISGTVTIANAATFTGLFTGSGTLNLNIGSGTFSLGGTGAGTQLAGFSGTISLSASAGTIKTRNDSAALTDKNFSSVTLDLGTGTGTLVSKAATSGTANSGSVTQTIGALAGGTSTTVDSSDTAGISATFTYNVGGLNTDAQFDGVIKNTSGRGTTAIVKSGTGKWTLNGANTYSGSTTISNGTIALGSSGSINNTTNLVIAAGATFNVSNIPSYYALSASTTLTARGTGTTVGSTAATITGDPAGTVDLGAQPLNLTWAGGASGTDSTHPPLYVSQGTLNLGSNPINVAVSGSSLGVGVYTLITAPAITGSVNPTPTYTGGNGLVGGNSGVLSISGNSVILTVTFTAVTATWTNNADGNWTDGTQWSINPLVPQYAGDTAILGVGTALRTVTLDNNESVGHLVFTNANSFVIANAGLTLTLDNSGSGASVNVTNGTANDIQTAVALNGPTTFSINSGSAITVSGAASGVGALTKAGNGTLTLSGANTYSGTTAVNGGTVIVSADSGLGTAPVSTVTNQLTLNGGTLSVPTGFTMASQRGLTLGVGGGTIDVASSQTLAYGYVISGTGNLTKNGDGTLDLTYSTTDHTYGNLTLNAGTIAINKSSGLGTGTVTVNGGTIRASSATVRSPANAVQLNGNVTLGASGTGILNFTGPWTINGATRTITVDTITVTNAAAIGQDVAGRGLIKDGTGTLVFKGTNTYTGNTTVNVGMLEIVQPTIATSSTVSVADGAILRLDFAGVNQVGSFITNGVSLPNGTYNSGNVAPFIAGTGSLVVGPVGPTGPGFLTNSVSGGALQLSWPAGQGWRLQSQTNSLSKGLGTNWVYLTDGSVSSTNLTISPALPTAFYRLTYP